MSSQTDITALALQDILQGIASGLNDAQKNLRDVEPYDSFGRPNTIYQVPYLDFNLQVTAEFQTVSEDGGDAGVVLDSKAAISGYSKASINNANISKSVLKFQPAKPTSKNESKTEIFSSISGRFVATVPNEGLPQTVIQVKTADPVDNGTEYEIELEVEISNSVGERLANSTVEFNYDDVTSENLSGGEITDLPTFTIAEVNTDSVGIAKSTVKIPKTGYDDGNYYVININVGTVHKSVSLSKLV
ncbi:MAG: hypothetical protein MI810_25195 [Flavobacteriales bacterium]|jgi:hypothetical protein|nr:hypothetical protein [Flavobacteriales bacterium]